MARDFSLLINVHTGPGAHPAFYSVGTVVVSLSIKGLVLEVDHLLPYCAEVKNGWCHTSAPHMPSWCEQGQHYHHQLVDVSLVLGIELPQNS